MFEFDDFPYEKVTLMLDKDVADYWKQLSDASYVSIDNVVNAELRKTMNRIEASKAENKESSRRNK